MTRAYKDPTADEALNKIRQEEERLEIVIKIIKLVCKLGGFRLMQRIVLVDKKSDRIYN
ncbi:hypothetical protein [uncultured Veillonella sp.]|uniref:hypothetical protein n=1 Tax=uncultured Veillonella sp. TaxID=159268 RepID=UPI0025CF155F|nr:hypothetical protein [uncultured Veillonella sp.]